jgi:hypothetical protein
MAASFENWSPYQSYVQSGGQGPGMKDGLYVSGAWTGIFAGPPRLAAIGGALAVGAAIENPAAGNQIVYPVGVTQSFSLSQNRQFARIFELGSERSYFIGGRTIGQVGLSRVMYHGPSMLRVMYAYYNDGLAPTVVESLFPNLGASTMANPHDVVVPPGYENFYCNLASDLFTQPVGLLVILRDTNQQTYGAFYLESVVIPNISTSTDAQGVVMQESAALQYENLVPIATNLVQLVT